MAIESANRVFGYLSAAKNSWELTRARTDVARQRARKHLIERMGRLRGLPQKLGQLIGFSHGDEESAADYSQLQESAEPLPLHDLLPVVEAEWGQPFDRVVKKISPHGNAASLGQVHRATLRDGREVAIKIQYPGIRDAVHLDLKMLGWLSLPVGGLHRGFDLAGYQEAILKDIENELDYQKEAQHQRAFFEWSRNNSQLVVPEVVNELTTSKVLVSNWEEGEHWHSLPGSWSTEEKHDLSVRLIELFHEGLFQRGLLHADLHPGNVRFRRTNGAVQLLFYDFGCIYQPSDVDRLTLLRLLRASTRQDEAPYPLFLKLGFRGDYLQAMSAKLPALCKVLFEPYAANYPYDIRNWRLSQRVGDILGDDRWNFRIAGPPSQIFLLRAFHGLNYYLQGLEARVAWSRTIEPLFEKFEWAMQDLALSDAAIEAKGFEGLARELKIRVSENDNVKAQITHRAACIDRVDELLGEELTERIERQGIKLRDIVASVRRRCYAPGEVFRMTDGAKEIHVWLE